MKDLLRHIERLAWRAGAVGAALCVSAGVQAEPGDTQADLDAPQAQAQAERHEPVRRTELKFPTEVFFFGEILCLVSVHVGRDGRPTEVTADEDCPPRLRKSARDALIWWRWDPQPQPFTYVFRLHYKNYPNFGLNRSYVKTITGAYKELPSHGGECEIGLVLYANGRIADLTTNDKARCMGLPVGKLALSERRSRKLSHRHTCTLDLKVTSRRIERFQADRSCPPPLIHHLRSRMSGWRWVAPERSTRPYQVTVTWERQQR